MTIFKLFRLASRVVACVYVLSLSACCSTHGLTCSPEPGKKNMEFSDSDKVCFNLESVKHISSTNVSLPSLSDFGVIYLTDAELRSKVMQRAQEIYPKLFSDASGAIPLDVTITRTAYADLTGAGNCVSCLTLTIYPMPINENVEYTVVVKSTKDDINQRLSTPVTFNREDQGRRSCFPLGWIPAFGAKGKTTWDPETSDRACEKLMLDSCINAVVTALQRVNPAALKNQK